VTFSTKKSIRKNLEGLEAFGDPDFVIFNFPKDANFDALVGDKFLEYSNKITLKSLGKFCSFFWDAYIL